MDHTNDRYLYALKYMNATIKADNAAGRQWRYCNTTNKKARSFPGARKAGKYLLNCVDGVQWAAKIAGVPSSALAWFCQNGNIIWCGANAEKNAKKYFRIIRIGNKTVKQLQTEGILLPGDIIGYMSMSHTNCYYGSGKSFDSGHAFATGSGEGAKIRKVIGPLRYGSMKVSYILRLKDRTQYRVQCGAFADVAVMQRVERSLNLSGFKTVRIEEDGLTKLQAGLFESEANAQKLLKRIRAKGYSAIIKEI